MNLNPDPCNLSSLDKQPLHMLDEHVVLLKSADTTRLVDMLISLSALQLQKEVEYVGKDIPLIDEF